MEIKPDPISDTERSRDRLYKQVATMRALLKIIDTAKDDPSRTGDLEILVKNFNTLLQKANKIRKELRYPELSQEEQIYQILKNPDIDRQARGYQRHETEQPKPEPQKPDVPDVDVGDANFWREVDGVDEIRPHQTPRTWSPHGGWSRLPDKPPHVSEEDWANYMAYSYRDYYDVSDMLGGIMNSLQSAKDRVAREKQNSARPFIVRVLIRLMGVFPACALGVNLYTQGITEQNNPPQSPSYSSQSAHYEYLHN